MDLITPRDYRMAGEGVAFGNAPLPKKTMDKIEMLGKLNDRRNKYLGKRSKAGLLRLACEYERMKMPMMAAWIRAEAREL
jgi:hypothetical protein